MSLTDAARTTWEGLLKVMFRRGTSDDGADALVSLAHRTLMEEIEELRQTHGVRRSAAVALVAERHALSPSALDLAHFTWMLDAGGVDTDSLSSGLYALTP